MLELDARQVLLRTLQPPPAYKLQRAFGTTFTLDLLALLIAPLSFALSDWADTGDKPPTDADPYALLAAVRGYADRITVFCQAGQINIPRRYQQLYAYLEDSVVEAVSPDRRGVFHPKLWILRFVSEGAPVRYRVVCLTRNLTFDRSWDTVLALDGRVINRKNAFAVNHPLADFVAALPQMAVGTPPDRVRDDLDLVQGELRRVRFELPDGFEQVSFWPLGIPGHRRWPFGGRRDRVLVVSPFVSDGCLKRLADNGRGHVLVSRVESLHGLDVTKLGFASTYVLSDAAEGEPEDAEVAEPEGERALTGLHAKLYVADAGWDARVWTGSANATDQAFKANVEFLVELRGKKSRCGVDAVLGSNSDRRGLSALLEEFIPAGPAEADPLQEALERRVDELRRALATAGLVASVADGSEHDTFAVTISRRQPLSVGRGEVKASCWPISLAESGAVPVSLGAETLARFDRLSFPALTSFFAFSVSVTEGNRRAAARFVLKVPLQGGPQDRRDAVLRFLLRDREGTLRFLLLLLAEGGDETAAGLGMAVFNPSPKDWSRRSDVPLLEALLRALERNPGKLDEVARLVNDLRKTPEGRTLLPEGFDEIWQPIWSARCRLRHD